MSYFYLKCPQCGNKEKKEVKDCQEQPTCSKCFMDMIIEEVEVK